MLPAGITCGDVSRDLRRRQLRRRPDHLDRRGRPRRRHVPAHLQGDPADDVRPAGRARQPRRRPHATSRPTTSAATTRYVPARQHRSRAARHPERARRRRHARQVTLAGVTVAKTRTTEVDEGAQHRRGGHDRRADHLHARRRGSRPAPRSTARRRSPTTSAPRQTYVPGSLTATLNGVRHHRRPLVRHLARPATRSRSRSRPRTRTPPARTGCSWTFKTQVDDESANVRGGAITNQGTFTFTDAAVSGIVRTPQSAVISTALVEPRLQVAKTEDDADDRVIPGQDITYTVTASHGTSIPANVSPAHDVQLVDTVPAGITPVNGGVPVADDGTVNPDGGTWDEDARTITWSLGTIARTGVGGAPLRGAGRRSGDRRDELPEHGHGDRLQPQLRLRGRRRAHVRLQLQHRLHRLRLQHGADRGRDGRQERRAVERHRRRPADLHGRPDAARERARTSTWRWSTCCPTASTSARRRASRASAAAASPAPQLPPAGQPDGSTRLGWWIGDAGSSTSERTVRVVYTAHVDDRREPEATDVAAGQTYDNSARRRVRQHGEGGRHPRRHPGLVRRAGPRRHGARDRRSSRRSRSTRTSPATRTTTTRGRPSPATPTRTRSTSSTTAPRRPTTSASPISPTTTSSPSSRPTARAS